MRHFTGSINVFSLRRDVVIIVAKVFTAVDVPDDGARTEQSAPGGRRPRVAVDVQQRRFVWRLKDHVGIKIIFV